MRRSPYSKSGTPRARKRRFQRNHRKPSYSVDKVQQAPRAHRATKVLLAGIGKPEPTQFKPDPFQTEAVKTILLKDVVVTAPTGAGKTWIALEAADRFLNKGGRIWYATPLKALSNAKYEEFGEKFGPEHIGILTGDRKENPDAQIIVGTTEILRNQLYDAMTRGSDLAVDLAVLDEAHYLGDPDRGVVWEEVLIYLPSSVRLLLLSATVSNAHTVAQWLSHIRGSECAVISSYERPVPLHVLFRTPSGELTPFVKNTHLFPRVAEVAKASQRRKKPGAQFSADINDLIDMLREFDLLPAIIFLKSRADCDRALSSLHPSPKHQDEGGFARDVKEYVESYPELQNQRQLNRLLMCRAGSHHAGQLPAWRLLIEKMMVLGHLEVILSTSTVAAGVNFPARTVVILQSDRFDGRSFVDMTATEFHQMTGRAGRRGMDKAGFTLIVPGRYLDIPLIKKLLLSPPEPLQSKIGVNFSMALNLLLSHDPAAVQQLLGQSFAAFHENPKRARKIHWNLQKDFQRHLNLLVELGYVDENGNPTYDGTWAAKLRLDHPLLIADLIREGTFDGLDTEQLAALIAPFVIDKDKEATISKPLWNKCRHLWKKWQRMMRDLKPLAAFMITRGFDVPPILFWPAAAVLLWSHDVEWQELTEHVGADEGDLAMLILRTGDHLRQLVSLEMEKPQLAEAAREAIHLLIRPPLV